MRILSMYTMNDLRCVFIGTDESDDYSRMAVTDTVRPPYEYVRSKANIADLPSRGEMTELPKTPPTRSGMFR